jgi:hypothetical protein
LRARSDPAVLTGEGEEEAREDEDEEEAVRADGEHDCELVRDGQPLFEPLESCWWWLCCGCSCAAGGGGAAAWH